MGLRQDKTRLALFFVREPRVFFQYNLARESIDVDTSRSQHLNAMMSVEDCPIDSRLQAVLPAGLQRSQQSFRRQLVEDSDFGRDQWM